MSCKLDALSVNFISIDYQGEPRAARPLSESAGHALAVKAFPKSVPAGFRSQGSFHGIKVFAEDGYIYVSRFFDAGAVDAWGRAVLSARLVEFAEAAWSRAGRDALSIGRWLARTDLDHMEFGDALNGLAADIDATYPMARREVFQKLLNSTSLSMELLARALVIANESQHATIHAGASECAEAIWTVMLAMVPAERLGQAQFCTVCDDPGTMDRETIVIAKHVQPHKTSVMSSMLKFMKGGHISPQEPATIDPAAGEVSLIQAHGLQAGGYRVLLEELAEGPDWPAMSFADKHALLIDYIEVGMRHADPITTLASRWPLGNEVKMLLAELAQRVMREGARH
jgi:hypothetical protein